MPPPQARAELHTGQQVQYLNWDDGKMRPARVVAMKDRRVTLLDEASRTVFTLPYAAIGATPSSAPDNSAEASAPVLPSPHHRPTSPAAPTSASVTA